MILQLGLVLLASQGLIAESDGDTRIIGGKDAPEGFAKYQVSIRRSNGEQEWHHCGGSILNQEWVLTAAHCLDEPKMSELSIVVGTNKLNSGGDRYKIKKMKYHEHFSRKDLSNDVGLVHIDGKIVMKKNVKTIKLKKEPVAAGTKCTLTGWGYIDNEETAPNDLQYLEYTTISNKECNKRFKGSKYAPIDKKHLCLIRPKNKGSCQGDSGSPLVVTENKETLQIGIVSWAIGCAENYPDVEAPVSLHYDWIKKNIK